MRVKANGTWLNNEVAGPEGAPWLLLSHGIATSLAIWHHVAERLKAKYRVLRYDSRGHGGSDAPDGEYSLEMLGDDAIGLMDAFGIEKAHYGGLSLGGMTALGLALNHPSRLKSLIVCDARASAPAEYQQAWAERSAAVRARGMQAIVESTVTRWFAPDALQRRADIVDGLRGLVRHTSVPGYCGSAAALQKLDYGRRLGEIAVPALFLTGRQDQGAPPAVMREMHQTVRGSQFVEIPDAGHISSVEQPAAVAQAIERFLDDVEQRNNHQ
jgi:3-oxoadipate enol-lactonase